MIREQLYSSLFSLFSAVPGFVSATRVWKHWDSVPPEETPCLMLQQHAEHALYKKGLPTVWSLDIDLMIYVTTNLTLDPTAVPSSLLNPLLDGITAALKVDDIANNACTLGGLVSHAAFSGSIAIYEGTLGNEAVAVVPINILVPT